jgi:hypothetical protein
MIEAGLAREEKTEVGTGPSLAHLIGRPLGEILVAMGLTGASQIEEALGVQAEKGGRLGEILVAQKAVREEDVLRALAVQLDLPYLPELRAEDVDASLVEGVPINFAKQWKVLPVRRLPGSVEVAVGDPLATFALDDLQTILHTALTPCICLPQKIIDAINPARHRAGHRPHRQRQDLDPLHRAQRDQRLRPQDHHHRGPGRVPAQGREPDSGQRKGRPDLRPRPALDPAARPGRDPGGRNPRPRDRPDRRAGLAHRPPGFLHPPHQRRARRGHPSGGHGGRALVSSSVLATWCPRFGNA